MENKGWDQDSTGSPSFDPWREFPPTRPALFFVLSHASEHERTRDIGIASMDLPPHLYTYYRATCKFSRDSGAPAVFLHRNPSLWDPQVYPRSILRTRVHRCTFCWFRFV